MAPFTGGRWTMTRNSAARFTSVAAVLAVLASGQAVTAQKPKTPPAAQKPKPKPPAKPAEAGRGAAAKKPPLRPRSQA